MICKCNGNGNVFNHPTVCADVHALQALRAVGTGEEEKMTSSHCTPIMYAYQVCDKEAQIPECSNVSK